MPKPLRSGSTKKWLNDYPGVELVSRDRWTSYAQATVAAAPQAQQVVDRWHLLKNLREAIERLLERQSAVVNEALRGAESATETTASPTAAQAVQVSVTDDGSHSQPPSEPNAESPRR